VPNVAPTWNVISAFSISFPDISAVSPRFDGSRAPPHVPIHVLLCVFLN
jgi:hypothetical protein